MKFCKYLFTPGFILVLLSTLVVFSLFSVGAVLLGLLKVAFTIMGIWCSCFVAYVVAIAVRFTRYRDFRKDAAN